MRFAGSAFRIAALAGLLALGAGSAAAAPEPAPCAGTDMLATIARDDPGGHARILAAAEAVENGHSRFWKIEAGPGVAPSWLLGTIHLSDPRVHDLPPAIRSALDGARVIALENTSVLDPAGARAAYAAGIAHMIYRDGRTLSQTLPPETWESLKAATAERGIPGWAIMSWKPWMLTFGVVSYPACELKRWMAGLPILDVAIGRAGRAAGKPVLDLETVEDQFGAIDSIAEAEQLRVLAAVLRQQPKLVDLQEAMVRLWLAGRIDRLWQLSQSLLTEDGGADRSGLMKSLLETASYRRNHIMMANARPLIDGGGAFLAVGALHLIGEQGLVHLMRDAGYRVTAVP